MRFAVAAWGTLGLLLAVATSRGAGTIDTTGATLTIGTGSPMGTIFNQPDLPPGPAPSIPGVGTLGSIGTFSSQMPAFPGGGTGADGGFVAGGAIATGGGTFNFTSYTVNVGAGVTYSGTVVIKTTGDVVLNGPVTTTAPNASITFLCGGHFSIGAGGKVQTTAANSSILIDAGLDLTSVTGAQVVAAGDCEVRGHAGNLQLDGTKLAADPGDLTVRASGSVTLNWLPGHVVGNASASGDALLQAFGGAVNVTNPNNGADLQVSGDASTTIEAGTSVDVETYVSVHSALGAVRVSAFGGNLLTRAAFGSGTDMTLRASQDVQIPSARGIGAGGHLTVTAFGGDVNTALANGPGGFIGDDVTIEASGSVVSSGASFTAGSGSVLLRALGDRVSLDSSFVGTTTTGSPWIVRAASRIVITTGVYYGASVSLTCGAGGFSSGLASLRSTVGPLDVTALGPVAMRGDIYSYGTVRLTSCDAGVDASDSSIRTDNGAETTSPSITIQSFADAAGVIDVTNGTLETGEADAKSGDINLRVYQGKTAGGGDTVDSYVLVSKWTTTINAKNAAKSKLSVSGVLDLGSSTQDLHASSDFDVGTLHLDLDPPVTKGKKLVATGDGAVFTLTPNAKGGSRVPFTLTRTGDLTSAFPLDGQADARLRVGTLDTKGTVVLAHGKFTLAKAAGKLVAPSVFPQKVAAVVKGGGKDTLTLTLGFATGGTGPIAADAFSITLGDAFTRDVPAASFGPKKREKYTFKGNVGGLTNVTVDHAKGVVTVKGKNLDLGQFGEGANQVTIRVTFGGVTRSVVVRLVRTGTKLSY